jgi:hypothetical protein
VVNTNAPRDMGVRDAVNGALHEHFIIGAEVLPPRE